MKSGICFVLAIVLVTASVQGQKGPEFGKKPAPKPPAAPKPPVAPQAPAASKPAVSPQTAAAPKPAVAPKPAPAPAPKPAAAPAPKPAADPAPKPAAAPAPKPAADPAPKPVAAPSHAKPSAQNKKEKPRRVEQKDGSYCKCIPEIRFNQGMTELYKTCPNVPKGYIESKIKKNNPKNPKATRFINREKCMSEKDEEETTKMITGTYCKNLKVDKQ